jgi:hypothetical protein
MGFCSQISKAREGAESKTLGAGLYVNPDFVALNSENTEVVI